MSSVNKVILVGRLGKDPEVRHIEGDRVVANFSLATSEKYNDKSGNKVEQTEWHNIVLWRGLAEVAEKYLHKGDLVYIEGRLKTRSWEKDGVTRYTTEVLGDNMTMLGSKGSSGAGSPPSQERQPESNNVVADEPGGVTDDLPF